MDTYEQDYLIALSYLDDDELDQSLSALAMSQPNVPTVPQISPEAQDYYYYETIGDATTPSAPPEPYYFDLLESEDHTEQVPMREAFIPAAEAAAMPPPVPPRTRFLSVQSRSFRRPLSCDFSRNNSVDSANFAVSTSKRRVTKK